MTDHLPAPRRSTVIAALGTPSSMRVGAARVRASSPRIVRKVSTVMPPWATTIAVAPSTMRSDEVVEGGEEAVGRLEGRIAERRREGAVGGGPLPVGEEGVEGLGAVPVHALAEAIVGGRHQPEGIGDGSGGLDGAAQRAGAEDDRRFVGGEPAGGGGGLSVPEVGEPGIAGVADLVAVLDDHDAGHRIDATRERLVDGGDSRRARGRGSVDQMPREQASSVATAASVPTSSTWAASVRPSR